MPDRKGQTEQPKPAVELRTLLAVYFIKGVLYNFDTFYSVIIEFFFFLGCTGIDLPGASGQE